MDQRKHVLELIPEAEGAARLVGAAPRPNATGQCLGEQPAIHEEIERIIGSADLDGANRVLPHALDRGERCLRLCRALELTR